MGLGGAFITQNAPRHHHHHHHHRALTPSEINYSLFSRVGSGVRRILGGPASAPGAGPRNRLDYISFGNNFDMDATMDEDDDPDHLFHLLADEEEGLRGWDPGFNPARAFIRSEVLRRRNNIREEPPYKKQYTHPQPPEPGFTFDFAPKSPSEVIDVTTPVVERKSISYEPIVIDDDEDRTISDSRLGHPEASSSSISNYPSNPQTPENFTAQPTLVCGRCLNPLILGNNLTSEHQKLRRVWGLRCGHLIDGRCLLAIGQPPRPQSSNGIPSSEPLPAPTVDRKGKGKAKAAIIEEEPLDGFRGDGDNSIRFRLRSRHVSHTGGLSPSSSSSSTSSTKRPTRTKQTQIQIPPPEYTWYCPVPGCGREHASVNINGEWIPEREDGIYGTSSGSGSSSRRRGRRGATTTASGGSGRGVRWRVQLGHSGRDWSGYPTSAGPSGSTPCEGPRGAIPLFL